MKKPEISRIGLALGPVLFTIIVLAPIDGLSLEAKIVLGTAFLMGAWWVTEAIPIYVTALLPLVVFPILHVTELAQVSTFYADRIVFLMLGGFFLAAAIERTGLHQRFAFTILKLFGTNPKSIIGAFVLVTGVLSAWMSNTATTLLMLPIAIAIITSLDIQNKEKFSICLLLSIAYAASIGGIATLIGTSPNAIFASLSKSLVGIDVSFAQWLLVGLPVSAISLFVMWLYMVNVGVRIGKTPIIGEKTLIAKKLEDLGKISRDEKLVIVVFAGAVTAWITRGLVWADLFPLVDDSTIALFAAMSLFFIPSKNKRLLDWSSAVKIPWGILVLIGGGLALAGSFTVTGVDVWMADHLSFLHGANYFIIILVLASVVIFSEYLSNTATAALMIPVAAALAPTLGVNPILLMMPVAIAASYGFILPSSTPSNAIVLSSGHVNPKKMARIGLPLNIIGVLLVSVLTTLLVPLVWG
ncbi:SLC13 family permease [Candidatus Nitrosotenuis aquarius]|uniref:SLC13 family permease n=1 Tax=Candidatus Nitrosotenuis aquarius TaxID=1846278 RepID=UPI000C1E003B|nr:SLC13 family permease [Candidatus Nitrosotenuis aquarius]